MSGQKYKCRVFDSQDFRIMQSECEQRVKQLEKDVYDCCRMINNGEDVEDISTAWIKPREKENRVSWEFDMRDFPIENICIQLKNSHIYVRAYYKNVNIKQKILMPQNVDTSKLAAILTTSGILTISVPIESPISDNQKMRC
ncbi:uncharacterized protein LOC116803589 [Drosophila sechellia]|uniref:uncharacterized protein LOC116803589 n=1 Tax=Drosophila sechellia TaxID=7238 RepID=UPI0013DD8E90|nr:uncharacterized protein LOC116803589 [Drosophila sechellia]